MRFCGFGDSFLEDLKGRTRSLLLGWFAGQGAFVQFTQSLLNQGCPVELHPHRHGRRRPAIHVFPLF